MRHCLELPVAYSCLAVTCSASHRRPARDSAEGDALQIARFTSAEIVLRCHNDHFADKLREANRGSAFSKAA